MIMLHPNNQNYYGKHPFSLLFTKIYIEMANSTPMNLIFKGSDLKELIQDERKS